MAQEQGALHWELRVAMSLVRLRAGKDHEDKSRRILARAFALFTEGFDTKDLCAAKSMLESWFRQGWRQ